MTGRRGGSEATARRAIVAVGSAILIAALAGCAGTGGDTGGGPGGQPSGGGTGSAGGARSITGKWQLVSGTDEKGPITPGDAIVTFTFNGRSSGGHGPCNSFGATSTGTTIGPVSIRVGVHTDIACVEPELNTTEARYFAALGAIDTATITDGTLVLSGGEDTLQFVRPSR
jgi:heat shock protein HslJ